MAARKLMWALFAAVLAAAVVGSCRTPGLPQQAHFPLTGAHKTASCESCHTDGLAEKLPVDCAGCHLSVRPTPHFDGGCGDCHNTTSWNDAVFNHDTLPSGTPCASCHEDDRPVPHAEGDCALCHNTTTWDDAVFNHAAIPVGTTCASCHEADRPVPHDPGDCVQCHNTTSWDAAFDHSTLAPTTTCASCHEDDRPPAHYQGDCKTCHRPTTWDDATFDHNPFFPVPHRGVSACASCHPAPEGTASFTCLNCHEHRRSAVDPEHRDVRNYSYDTQRCLDCHPRGR